MQHLTGADGPFVGLALFTDAETNSTGEHADELLVLVLVTRDLATLLSKNALVCAGSTVSPAASMYSPAGSPVSREPVVVRILYCLARSLPDFVVMEKRSPSPLASRATPKLSVASRRSVNSGNNPHCDESRVHGDTSAYASSMLPVLASPAAYEMPMTGLSGSAEWAASASRSPAA